MVSVNGLAVYVNDLNERLKKVHCTLSDVFLSDRALVFELCGCDSFDFLLDLPHFLSCSYQIEPRYIDDDFQGYYVKISLNF